MDRAPARRSPRGASRRRPGAGPRGRCRRRSVGATSVAGVGAADDGQQRARRPRRVASPTSRSPAAGRRRGRAPRRTSAPGARTSSCASWSGCSGSASRTAPWPSAVSSPACCGAVAADRLAGRRQRGRRPAAARRALQHDGRAAGLAERPRAGAVRGRLDPERDERARRAGDLGARAGRERRLGGRLAVGASASASAGAGRREADRDTRGAASHSAGSGPSQRGPARHGPRRDGRPACAPSSVSYSTRSRATDCTTAQLACSVAAARSSACLDDRARLGVDALERARARRCRAPAATRRGRPRRCARRSSPGRATTCRTR